MAQNLTLELSDPVFTAIHQTAGQMGVSPERLITNLLEQRFSSPVESFRGEPEKESPRSNFERHFGSLGPASFMDADNESIDADLIAEYASLHEDN